MALDFTGVSARHPDGYMTHQAVDLRTDRKVVVRVSSEAETDKGLYACQQKASDKHSAGEIETDGSVWVRTTDF